MVVVRDATVPGHVRTPLYIMGKRGVVRLIHGEFRDPELLAYGDRHAPRRPLYLVDFSAIDLWPGGTTADTVGVGVYEHWLEPAI
jgi:nitrile hydratase